MAAGKGKSWIGRAQLSQVDSHTYEGKVPSEWTHGSAIQGGIALGLLLSGVRKHFETTHAKLKQHDILSVHAQFLRLTTGGSFKVLVQDTKIGRAFSNVHASLINARGDVAIVAYIIQTNLSGGAGSFSAESGVLELWPKLPAKSDTKTMLDGKDANWEESNEFEHINPIIAMPHYFNPRTTPTHGASGLSDRWMKLKGSTDVWTNEWIPYLVDLPGTEAISPMYLKYWLATLAMTIEFKKPLPAEGLEWLLLRTTTSVIRDGKYDFNNIVIDEKGDVVAMATQIMAAMKRDGRTGQTPDSKM